MDFQFRPIERMSRGDAVKLLAVLSAIWIDDDASAETLRFAHRTAVEKLKDVLGI